MTPRLRGELTNITAREADVLDRVSRGATNAQIARELCIQTGSVKNHLTHAYEKLGVTRRSEAIVAWHAQKVAS